MAERFDVLIVDDEPVVLDGARKILEGEGYTVDAAEDGESCLEKAQANRYRLVLCDLMLPQIPGLELVGKLRELLPGVPVVVITGFATLENAVRGFKAGVFDFIPKPFDVAELLGVVQRGIDVDRAAGCAAEAARLDRWLVRTCAAHRHQARAYTLGRHAWVIVEAGRQARIGMAETFAGLAGQACDVDLPALGDEVLQGNPCVQVTTRDHLVHRLWSPLSGTVLATNPGVVAGLERRDDDDVCQSWLITLKPGGAEDELQQLTIVESKPEAAGGRAAGRSLRAGKWSS